MNLETRLKDEDKIRLLEEEIFQLKKKLEVSKVVSLNQNNISDSKNFIKLFGVVDSDFNVLSVNDQWNSVLSDSQEEFYGKKCYFVFRGLKKSCEGCTISANARNKLVWYFIQPQFLNQNKLCKQSVINPITNIEPY